MAYKDPEKRRQYIKKWRAKKRAKGHYGKCNGCGGNLGRNDGHKGRNSNGYCIECNVGKVNQNWKGGYTNAYGYKVIATGSGRGNRKPRLQHRVIMEKHLGRKLLKDETVHHINGVRDDNRVENLELWVGAPVRGMRPSDAVKWAKEILKRYEQ